MELPNRLKTPSFLQKLQWVADPVTYMDNAVQKYPDIFTADIVGFGNTIVFVHHPQGIQEILSNDKNKLAALSEPNRILQPLVGEDSFFLLDQTHHKQRRQILMPPFHGERMRGYGQLICNLTENVLKNLPKNEPFSAHTVMQEISLQVILEAIFGLYEGECCQKLKHLFPLLLSIFHSPLTSSFFFFPFLQKDFSWSPWGKFLQQKQKIDEILYAEIAERRENISLDRIDILSLLMSAQDDQGKQMSDKELRDDLITLIFAGHETTATSIAWGIYWIHKTPKVLEKLLDEIDGLGDHPDPMSIARLPYLTAVCNEILRITPVAIFTLPRIVQETIQVLEHQLEPGTVVVGCIYLTHKRQDLYPEPMEFKPERFLENQFSPYEFIPFGGGSRGCIGQAFALFEMKLVLATALSNYKLALADQPLERPQRRGVTLAPANGVKVVITGQRKPCKPYVAMTNDK
ncbi:cytochrome P450 [Calothrix sp. NIES-2098]|uniref:cytochrome P450 n=1 Tax=Calothrix sp. NIES-2098 TaxID=1954171 RepID=UPI000B5ED28B|nr:cytochrome P450 [Calothrix sp. NIES-2098]